MSVIPVLQFLSGVVRKDITASLLLECTVEAVPPATLVEVRRRDEDGDVILSTMSETSQMLILQYTLGNLMVNDSGVAICMCGYQPHWTDFTLVVQGEWLLSQLVSICSSLVITCKSWIVERTPHIADCQIDTL